jgi:hypothetical protein
VALAHFSPEIGQKVSGSEMTAVNRATLARVLLHILLFG